MVTLMDIEASADELQASTPFSAYDDRWEALGEDLNDYLERHVGVGLMSAESLVVWQTTSDWGAYAEGDFGDELQGDTEEMATHPVLGLTDFVMILVSCDLLCNN